MIHVNNIFEIFQNYVFVSYGIYSYLFIILLISKFLTILFNLFSCVIFLEKKKRNCRRSKQRSSTISFLPIYIISSQKLEADLSPNLDAVEEWTGSPQIGLIPASLPDCRNSIPTAGFLRDCVQFNLKCKAFQ